LAARALSALFASKSALGRRKSGTTLANAEMTERVCYGIELDPK
jgi:hypothetical protein